MVDGKIARLSVSQLSRFDTREKGGCRYTKSPELEEDRFWEKVAIPADVSRCWEWQGSINKHGYGTLRQGKKYLYAHRVAFAYVNGPLSGCACHKCDNRKCCNPSHIFDGTRLENQQDMARKGRAAKGERNGSHRYWKARRTHA
jgi:hypothetical protein